MRIPDRVNKKNAIINRLIVYHTISYLLALWLISIILKVPFDWVFTSNNNLDDFKIIFKNHHIIAFILFKYFPIVGLVVSILSNIYLIIRYNIYFLKIYDIYLFLENIYFKYLFLAIVSAVMILLNATKPTLIYHIALTFSIIFILFQLALKKHADGKIQMMSLLIIATLLRILYFSITGTYDMQEDSLARVAQLYHWDKYGGILGGLTWLPGHHLLMYFLSKIFFISYESAGCLLSLICSISIIPVTYFFFSKIFDKGTAYLALLFYALNPLFIRFAAIQMVEIPFLFFIISGLSTAYLYFEKEEKKYLFLSVVCLNISNLLRFEAWIIIPLFTLIYFFEFRYDRKTIIWSALSMFSALMFSLISFINTGNPIYGVTASDVEVKAELANIPLGSFAYELLFWTPIPIIIIPFLIMGLVYAIAKNKNRYLAIGIMFLASYYIYKMANQTLMPFWRYLFFVIFLTLPFLFYYLQRFISFKWLLLLFSIYYGVKTSENITSVLNTYQPPPKGFFESAAFYRSNFLNDQNAKLILSMNPYSQLITWKIHAGIYWDRPIFQRLYPGAKTFIKQDDFTVANARKKITEENYQYIVIQKGYEIDSILFDPVVMDYLRYRKVKTDNFGEIDIIKID